MEIIKIIGFSIISLIIILILKQYKSEFVLVVSLFAGITILFLVMDRLTGIINLIQEIKVKFSINAKFISLLIKSTGIALLAEFAISVCKDAGESAIANKIELSSKIIILSMAIPIFSSLMEIILKILP